jgi:hypothetical protein
MAGGVFLIGKGGAVLVSAEVPLWDSFPGRHARLKKEPDALFFILSYSSVRKGLAGVDWADFGCRF